MNRKAEASDLAVPVLLNDQRADLPAIHAACNSDAGDKATFYFLDDPANPLTLAFELAGTTPGSSGTLQVIKIEIPPQHDATNDSNGNQIQQQLATSGRAEVYGIYFDFGSDKIRPESEPVLKEIADALTANPGWKLSVEGHTDNIGGDAYNLDLSNRRAAAVTQTAP